MTGVVLPHDTFGSHIHNGQTTDVDLEKRNFKAAGEVLGELWSNLEIDGFEVRAEFVDEPASVEIKEFVASPSFRNRHVFESQYLTSYMKCDDRLCCSPPRTSVLAFFPHRRIPALIPISRTSSGVTALPLGSEIAQNQIKFPTLAARQILEESLTPQSLKSLYGKSVPYDAFLPSCQDKIEGRTCKVCYKYHATKKSLQSHKRICKRSKSQSSAQKRRKHVFHAVEDEFSAVDESDDTDSEDNLEEEDEEELEVIHERTKISFSSGGGLETILNLREWLKSPWQE